MYFELNDDRSVKSYLDCGVEGHIPYPSCQHYFRYDNLYIKLNYNKSNSLEYWHGMRQSAIDFIDGFKITKEEIRK